MADGRGRRAKDIHVRDKMCLTCVKQAEVTEVNEMLYQDEVFNLSFEGAQKGAYLVANSFYSGDFYMQNSYEVDEKEKEDVSAERRALWDELVRR